MKDITVSKPVQQNWLRYMLAREIGIFRRWLSWRFFRGVYAKKREQSCLQNLVFEHQSIILRKLKDVDMILQINKRENLKLAIAKLDGLILKPGETFSFWKCVGRPTGRKGYLDGLVLKGGMIERGRGGGLCQLGNLLFWIFMHSPLTITERHRHSFDVFPDSNRHIPFGSGATLAFNYIDLQVRNDSENTFQIKLWMDTEYLNGHLLCDLKLNTTYKVEERNHIIRQEYWGGYIRHNQIVRVVQNPEGTLSDDYAIENHALLMYSPFLKGFEPIVPS